MMRNRWASSLIRGLLESARYEVLPAASVGDKVLAHVPVGRTVTVTASAGKGLDATLDLTETLCRSGYHVVPHLAARMVRGRGHLQEVVDRLVALGVDTVFVPAGDATPTADGYQGSLDLLEDLGVLGRPFPHVGVAGYPESHPLIDDDVAVQAMWDKREHATHVVSNLCFDPVALTEWIGRMRRRGTPMPLWVGLAGPVERAKLVLMASKIGVGESTRFLAKNKSVFARIATPGGYSPERFLDRLAPTVARPESLVEGLHVFTFNQVRETEQWRRDMLVRLGGSVIAS
jgi:methylenetetrahydrofolate reductase (NADPH)